MAVIYVKKSISIFVFWYSYVSHFDGKFMQN